MHAFSSPVWTLRFLLWLGGLAMAAPLPAAEVSFRNDVMAVLSKSGCNLGTCHGNARGKGGFQLSLRGQDPAADFAVLTHELFGRRTNPNRPEQSLLLLKPSMQIAHEGGKRLIIDSPEYQVLREWIAAGMPNDRPDARTLEHLRVTPEEAFLAASPAAKLPAAKLPAEKLPAEKLPPAKLPPAKLADPAATTSNPGWQQQITAHAEFSDGSVRDVSSLAVYELSQPIAEVSHNGFVSGQAVGETTIIVRYLNQQAAVRLAFVPDRPDFIWNGPTPANFIDELVFTKLKTLKINPSPVCNDATFIRRVMLDLLGLPPTAAEGEQFVADSSPNKRSVLIDSLLERPEFAEWWAMKWADLLRIEEKTLDRKGVENFHAWLRDAFANHKPLDQLVREIVAGQGSTYEVPPANFYRALRTPFERSEAVGQLFLGVRLQCSKCHNHPFDRWTQDDYYSWGNVFGRIDYKILENRRRDSNDKHEFDGEQIVFLNESGVAKDPRTNQPRSPQFLGHATILQPRRDPLNGLAEWLTAAQHERFVQVLSNRTWHQVMGRGIVDPIDDFRATNPPSNPELLRAISQHLVGQDRVAQDRVEGEHAAIDQPVAPATSDPKTNPKTNPGEKPFDLRRLLRVILNSQTYQLSADFNESNQDDEANFSRSLVQRRSAEQLLDAISQVLEIPLEFAGYPAGRRAAQLPGVTTTRGRDGSKGNGDADQFLKLFGKPPRLQSCDCERSDETTLGQTFQLVSGSLINRFLTKKENRLGTLLASNKTDREILSELYWTTLTRPPTAEESAATLRFLGQAADRRAALEDITWGLLNSNEFLLRR